MVRPDSSVPEARQTILWKDSYCLSSRSRFLWSIHLIRPITKEKAAPLSVICVRYFRTSSIETLDLTRIRLDYPVIKDGIIRSNQSIRRGNLSHIRNLYQTTAAWASMRLWRTASFESVCSFVFSWVRLRSL